MAVYSEVPTTSVFAAAVDRIASTIVDFAVSLSTSQTRYKQIEALSQLTDEDLAAKGLKREDIVRHVFRDVYYV